jgi:hypothetical protein
MPTSDWFVDVDVIRRSSRDGREGGTKVGVPGMDVRDEPGKDVEESTLDIEATVSDENTESKRVRSLLSVDGTPPMRT